MPKISLYNHFQRWNEDYYIAYSARSGAVALMTTENYATYKCLCDKFGDENCELNEKEQELLKQLEYGKFVCADDHDELAAIEVEHNVGRYNVSELSLVIAPTLACNMACEYCYEANKTGRMSPEMVDTIADFVAKRGEGITGLSVTWYGGEPLLAQDIIEDLSGRFIELSEKHRFRYSATIVTNGYLLTPEVADKLRELQVHGAQITLDGPAELHDRKRRLKNGRESYAAIVKNMEYAADRMKISVRVNIDKNVTAQAIEQLLIELKDAGLNEKVSVAFGHLEAATEVCANIAESCYDAGGFAEVETDYFRLLLRYGFRIDKLPAPTSVCCMAQIVNSFLIDPEGYLYRCWNYTGNRERAMGNIADQLNFGHDNFHRLFSVNPFDKKSCRSCDLLPICMGGCPARQVDGGLTGDQLCESWKHNLEPMLEIIAASRQQEAMRAAKEQS